MVNIRIDLLLDRFLTYLQFALYVYSINAFINLYCVSVVTVLSISRQIAIKRRGYISQHISGINPTVQFLLLQRNTFKSKINVNHHSYTLTPPLSITSLKAHLEKPLSPRTLKLINRLYYLLSSPSQR